MLVRINYLIILNDMVIKSVESFVKIVEQMRLEQKAWSKRHSYLTPCPEDQTRLSLEKAVDKAISEHKKIQFREEMDSQGELPFC